MSQSLDSESAIGDFAGQSPAEKSGLEQLESMLSGETPPPAMAETLSFRLSHCEYGLAVFTCEPQERHLNPLGTVHGGLAATLLDSCLGCAVHTTLKPGEGYTTIDLNVKYLRPILPTTGQLRAEGRIVHRGRRMATAEGKLLGPDGKVYAHGGTTCMVFPP